MAVFRKSRREAQRSQIKPALATRRPVGAKNGPKTTPEGPSKNGPFNWVSWSTLQKNDEYIG